MKKLKRLIYLKLARRLSKSTTGAPVPSIVSENTKVKGDFLSDGIIHIDGYVEGDVTCDELIIGVKGCVSGSVNVRDLQLYGTLRGKACVDALFVAKTAKLVGDATHNTIAIEPGAYIDGLCLRKDSSLPVKSSKPELVLVNKTKKTKTA
jgi:cytoskeletal protein CcmA (bactofilin family)